MLQRIAPILPALNILTTNLFYRDTLNFDISYSANYLVVSKEKICIYFFEQRDKTKFQPASCYIFVSNIEDVYAQFSSANMIVPLGKLVEKAGRIKEFFITDNNLHQLRFSEKTD